MRSEYQSYFEENEFLECLSKYEEALKNGEQPYMDADELTDIAEYYMLRNREQDANKCILLATTLHPEAIDPQIFLARQQLFHNNIEKAEKIAQEIVEQNDREVVFLWAEIAIKSGEIGKANKILSDYYETIDEEKDLFLYDSAGVFMDYEEWGMALIWATRLKEEYPEFDRTEILMCDILVSCGRIKEATPLLESIIDRNPFEKEAWELLAEAQSAQEKYEAALESTDYLLAIDEKHHQGQVLRANCLYHLNRIEESHKQYEAYLKEVPQDGNIRFYDAMVLTAMEKYQEAYDQLLLAIDSLDHSTAEYYQSKMQLCYILSKQNKPEEALGTLESSYLEGKRDFDSEYYFMQGHILLENDKYDDALSNFDRAESLTNDLEGFKLMRSIEYIENERYTEGVDILRNLLNSSMKDKEANCYPYLAYGTYFIKDHPDHRNYLHLAAQFNPKLTEYLFAPIYPNIPISQYNEL
ncbi:MAG: tetratricopeptide repeat protein [Bacteroidaceae bacterium]|nr:tetratricopeptide repeat protein [Bacteroidaceae bacterium]